MRQRVEHALRGEFLLLDLKVKHVGNAACDLLDLSYLLVIQAFRPAWVEHAECSKREVLTIDDRKTGIARTLLKALQMRMILPCRILDHVFHDQRFRVQKHVGTDIELMSFGLRTGDEIVASGLGDGAFHLAVIQAESGRIKTGDVFCQIAVNLKKVWVGRIDQAGLHDRLSAQFLVIRAGCHSHIHDVPP